MKNKSLFRLISGFSLVLILVTFPFNMANAQKEKPIELSFASPFPPTGPVFESFQWWINELNKRTGGTVSIKILWGGTLARSMEMAEAVRTGTADIGDSVWEAYFPAKFVLHTITDHPIPFNDRPLASWIAAERLVKEFPEFDEELAANNMKRLAHYGVGNVHLISRKPIRKIEDLKGLKIRCSGKLHLTLIKAVGAVPTFIPSAEAFDALQKGVIDASTCTARWAVDYKYHEAAKYFTVIGLGGDPGMGPMMNLDVWKKLPQNVQHIFLKLREEFPIVYEEMDYKETMEKSYKALKESGVEVINLPRGDIETWKNLSTVKNLPEEWIAFVMDKRNISKTRINEILKQYSALLGTVGNQYPRKY